MRSKQTTTILSLLFGGIGVQKFYLGQYWKGILSILFCWTIIPFLVGLYDCIRFSKMSNEYFQVKFNSNKDLKCSTCKTELSKENVSFWGFGQENGACKSCFKKIRNHSKETGKYSFEDDEVQKILNGEIKNRPLPKTDKNTFYVPEEETTEDFELPEGFASIKLNSLAQIIYIDSKDQKSERRITMNSVSQTANNDYVIKGYCHEKKAQRTFRLTRIQQLTDMETGEIFENPSQYFTERFQDSPIGRITKIFQELESEILILTFVARADGYLRIKEREIIMKFIIDESNADFDKKLLENEIRRTYCPSQDFRDSLKKVSKETVEYKTKILDLSTDIVNTDKNPDPIELGALELIKRELKLIKVSS
ncbi:NINE protein [Aureibaculum sp. 2210JD6-5]|uniref:NINE protein n=1 Tax=Aureibaculum sp. 2210JD6-5 TaxID=3103957 RepID=UPI002AAEDF69|nr:NINE protein [Aureibaculum sp. 2210JD6-5]MDY7395572.1 NINE protein [Aureibaculum sp. 2210JD6-5]